MHLRIQKKTLEDSERRHLRGGTHLANPQGGCPGLYSGRPAPSTNQVESRGSCPHRLCGSILIVVKVYLIRRPIFLEKGYISKAPWPRRNPNSFKSTIKKSSSSDQALEPPYQLELHSLEHSYIGLEIEGCKHCLVFGSVGDCLVVSLLSLLLLYIRSYIIHLVPS
jgi:hypothetical protein